MRNVRDSVAFFMGAEEALRKRVTSLIDFPALTFSWRNGVTSASIRCDYCRGELESRVHQYWHMRFVPRLV